MNHLSFWLTDWHLCELIPVPPFQPRGPSSVGHDLVRVQQVEPLVKRHRTVQLTLSITSRLQGHARDQDVLVPKENDRAQHAIWQKIEMLCNIPVLWFTILYKQPHCLCPFCSPEPHGSPGWKNPCCCLHSPTWNKLKSYSKHNP